MKLKINFVWKYNFVVKVEITINWVKNNKVKCWYSNTSY